MLILLPPDSLGLATDQIILPFFDTFHHFRVKFGLCFVALHVSDHFFTSLVHFLLELEFFNLIFPLAFGLAVFITQRPLDSLILYAFLFRIDDLLLVFLHTPLLDLLFDFEPLGLRLVPRFPHRAHFQIGVQPKLTIEVGRAVEAAHARRVHFYRFVLLHKVFLPQNQLLNLVVSVQMTFD